MNVIRAFVHFVDRKFSSPPLISYEEHNNNILRQVLSREIKPKSYPPKQHRQNCGPNLVRARGDDTPGNVTCRHPDCYYHVKRDHFGDHRRPPRH